MAYINLFVGSDASVSIKNNQLVLKSKTNQDLFPVEDIDTVMIENQKTVISSYTMSALAKHNVLVFFCDEKHLPCACLLPYNAHFSPLKIFEDQTSLAPPLRKQLWQSIVSKKIENQNECLRLCGEAEVLKPLVKLVKSDDSTNIEAVAASKYFRVLFGTKFTRQKENSINSALNYGYAIIRGVIARSIVSHGLLPFLGIKHHSVLNNYNLADDLIEVFRPFVDLCVSKNFDLAFNREYKMTLYNLLNCDCDVDGAKYTLSYAIELYIQSFLESLAKKRVCLKFPNLIELAGHEYL